MLLHLTIQNFALIDSLEIEAQQGFTIITGETGAGKSILLGALALIAGQRADANMLLDKNKKCIVEAHFEISNYALETFFELNELDYAPKTIVRRELTAAGKTRAFINDTPVTLTLLKELSNLLIDIHSQHQSLEINTQSVQLNYLDLYCLHLDDLKKYEQEFKKFNTLKKQLAELTQQEIQYKKDIDYYHFQLNELEEAALKIGEYETKHGELSQLANVEVITTNLSKVNYLMEGEGKNILQQINEIKNALGTISKYNLQYDNLQKRVVSIQLELKDIAAEVSNFITNTEHNPQKIEQISERLNTIEKLFRKHDVKSEESLIAIQHDFDNKIQQANSLTETISQLVSNISVQENTLEKQALKIRKKRLQQIPSFEKEITDIVKQLGMPKAQFKIQHTEELQLNKQGKDSIEFLFSANQGIAPMPMVKVASGGELSRLMLAIKSIISKSKALPTIVFDEIDTGVSGEVADKMSTIMLKISQQMQVFAITHLPQIASKGNIHWFVFKQEKNKQTSTQIKILDKAERINEIAKMLSSEKPTQAAFNNAKELLGINA